MKYSKDYKKLCQIDYTTIRRYSKAKEGDIIVERYPSGFHEALVVKVERKPISELSTMFLFLDTDEHYREKAYNLIQSFYKKSIDFDNERFYIYHLRKLTE